MKILKFSSERCTPCKALDEFLKSNTPPDIEIISITSQETFKKYKVQSIPLLIQVDDEGKEVKRWRASTFMGYIKYREFFDKSQDKLNNAINDIIYDKFNK